MAFSLGSHRVTPLEDSLVYNAPPTLATGGGMSQGLSPTSTMTVTLLSQKNFPGSWRTKTLQITYDVPSGTQLPYHENPGNTYTGTTRVAFLPNNNEGRKLLARLKHAFSHGLIFIIGTSLTTGQRDVVTWSSIPHKTSLQGGQYGFPDSKYISKCHAALDSVNVPSNPRACTTQPQQRLNIHQHVVQNEKIVYMAPRSLADSHALSGTLQTPSSAKASGDCSICLDGLCTQHFVHIQGCDHAFHYTCITEYLNHELKCPICRSPVADEPQGKGPSGSMFIKITNKDCPGFAPNTKAIEITYNIPSGTQALYHESPGTRFGGANRTAFLPNNQDGRRLLTRLKYAFTHGLTFRVGTSLTSGVHNVVTWASIHHKTSLFGGAHGFPDASYIANCNDSLDALHVPSADDC